MYISNSKSMIIPNYDWGIIAPPGGGEYFIITEIWCSGKDNLSGNQYTDDNNPF